MINTILLIVIILQNFINFCYLFTIYRDKTREKGSNKESGFTGTF